MTRVTDCIKRHPLTVYFTLAFIVSWGAVIALAGPKGIPVAPDQAVTLGMALLLGPIFAAAASTGLGMGKNGFITLFTRLFKWRIPLRWYAIALLTAPLSTIAGLLVLSFYSSEYTPAFLTSLNDSPSIMMAVVAGFMVGICEEIGWTGFAVPMMRRRRGIGSTGLIVGLLWGAWHFIMFWEGNSFSGTLPLVLLFARLFAWLPAYRILMVWIYDRSESLFVVILMHVSLVTSLILIEPPLTGEALLTFILLKAAILWAIAAAVTRTRASASQKDPASDR